MSETDARAKKLVSAALAGPYGHPFHPLLVTMPIGAWVASVVFDIGSHVADDAAALELGARWLLAIGVLGALAAACVGFLDFILIPRGTMAHRIGLAHLGLNLLVTAGFAASFAWRLGDTNSTPAGPMVLSFACLALLGVSGALGGHLAYHYGVRVADDAVQASGFETTDRGA